MLLLGFGLGQAAAQDMALRAANLAGSESRLWQSHGRAGFALSLDSLNNMPPASDRGNTGLVTAVPSLTLGLQLNPGYRLSLKVRRGGPVLYLRSRF